MDEIVTFPLHRFMWMVILFEWAVVTLLAAMLFVRTTLKHYQSPNASANPNSAFRGVEWFLIGMSASSVGVLGILCIRLSVHYLNGRGDIDAVQAWEMLIMPAAYVCGLATIAGYWVMFRGVVPPYMRWILGGVFVFVHIGATLLWGWLGGFQFVYI